jgi:plastocyanin
MDAGICLGDNRLTASGRVMLAAAPSKVPFYIAGVLLVVWVVVLAALGISHAESFPGSAGRARLIMLTSFVLVAATITTAVLTGGEEAEERGPEAGAAPVATGRTLALVADPGGALRFDHTRAAVLHGRVTVRLTNDSTVEHNVTIAQGSRTFGATKTITESTDTLAVEFAAGDYVFFCSVAGHRESGMEGTLSVE